MTVFSDLMTELLELRVSVKSLGERLEASQAREAQLREALNVLVTCRPMGCETLTEARERKISEVLAMPHDASALKARLKAERERCAKAFSQWDRDGRWAAGVIRNLGDE